MVQARNLKPDEINEVQKVFQKSVDLSNVYICKPIRSEGGVITVAGWTGRVWVYQILWSTDVFDRSAVQANMHDTLVHEMTHVWQGQHGIYPTVYMAQSLWQQLSHGVKDIIDKGGWRTWDEHRGTAYLFNMADIGANWDRFNVEQQANIIETWYLEQVDNLKAIHEEVTITITAKEFTAAARRRMIRVTRISGMSFSPVNLPKLINP